MGKVEPIEYGDRRVYSVSAFNRGVASWLTRLPTVWVEGELTELRRQPRWQSVFFTLKDPGDGACLPAVMPRGQFDALRLDLENGERVHVYGRPELWESRGELRLRVLSIERLGLGAHLAALERLKRKLAAEGLFAVERKRPLPRWPRRIGLVTGTDAAAKRDVVTAVTSRFSPARLLVAETFVQGPRAAAAIVEALRALCAEPEIDVVVLTRGGGSFEDLLPFSDESVVRAVAACPVPVVSAVGHEQDTPLCDLAADVRASTPTAAARLVVPDFDALVAALERARAALAREARRGVEQHRERLDRNGERLRRAPLLLLERRRATLEQAHAALARDARRGVEQHRERLDRNGERLRRAPLLLVERRRATLEQAAGKLRALSPRATLARGYAIVRREGGLVRSSSGLVPEDLVDVELAEGSFAARVEETRP